MGPAERLSFSFSVESVVGQHSDDLMLDPLGRDSTATIPWS